MRMLVRGLGVLGVGFLLLLLIVGIAQRHLPRAVASIPQHPAASAPTVSAPSFADRVRRQLGRQPRAWEEIRFDPDNSAKSIAVTLVYRRTPSGYAQVKADTARIARAVLAALVADGRPPHEEWISVFVHAEEPAGGGGTGP